MEFFRLKELTINCKQEVITKDLSNDITYFYGEIGSGKSTIVRLIDFCFGGRLEKTPAIESEFISAELFLSIGEKKVHLLRSKDSSNIFVNWKLPSNEEIRLKSPIKTQENPILNDNIYGFSDLMFYFMGIKPMKVKRSKRDEESPLIRLSFRDILWYCYLDQDEIDSNFFNLSLHFLMNKSRDVMRFLIGFYSDNFNELQINLNIVKDEKKGKEAVTKSISEFLERFSISSEQKIENKIELLSHNIENNKLKKKKIKQRYLDETSAFDNFRSSLDEARRNVINYTKAIEDLDIKIQEQKSLKAEYESSRIKIERISTAELLFSKVSFENCPLCETKVESKRYGRDHCDLCGTELSSISKESEKNRGFLKNDLDLRTKELDESINIHKRKLSILRNELKVLRKDQLNLDIEYGEKVKVIESRYSQDLVSIEKEITSDSEKIRSLRKMIELPKELQSIHEEINDLIKEESILAKLIEEERKMLPDPTGFKTKLQDNYFNILLDIEYPGVSKHDSIELNMNSFIPKIKLQSGHIIYDFDNAGSGGKKTLLKVCYALALHKTTTELHSPLPNFLIIDTPMKNIGELNEDIFRAFYNKIYNLHKDSLQNTQLIIIDKKYFSPLESTVNIYSEHMNPDDNPLIPTYRESNREE